MNSMPILLIVIAILLRTRQQIRQQAGSLMSAKHSFAIFVAVLLMHVGIVAGLVAFNHYRHS